mgnify:FL=1
MHDARHFFPFLPVAFALGIAIYFVWPQQTADGGYAACRFPACRIELQSGAELVLETNARHLTAACDAVDVVLVRYFRARYPCAAHLVDLRALKPFANTLVYVKRTQSGLHFVTRIPEANAMRIWQRNDAQAP